MDDTEWKEHGKFIAESRSDLPSSFDRPPRNPAEKVTSGFKCWEFIHWIYAFMPALLYGKIPDQHWRVICQLVAGVRIIFQKQCTHEELQKAHKLLSDFKYNLEDIFAQRKISCMRFMPQCTHAVTHFPTAYMCIGPLICSSQFPIERTIGDLGAELRQPSNPFANLAQRALLRAQTNTLKAMYREFDDMPAETRPSLILHANKGYALLHPRDDRPRCVLPAEEHAIQQWIETKGGADAVNEWISEGQAIRHWARCRIPGGEDARSAWKELSTKTTRSSRYVQVYLSSNFRYIFMLTLFLQIRTTQTDVSYVEVLYYFQQTLQGVTHNVALVNLHGPPDPHLLETSYDTVWAARHHQGLGIIDTTQIITCVGMAPRKFQTPFTNGSEVLYFVIPKLGADVGRWGDQPWTDDDSDADDDDDDE
ncbi:hypothetical protein OF83DRAFT_1058212 [Amylostereum chailletii]|nr:hypothetical protein OF83DRAFT_1058212 [Amylostereum chailletii]